jgi:hypothetical protein
MPWVWRSPTDEDLPFGYFNEGFPIESRGPLSDRPLPKYERDVIYKYRSKLARVEEFHAPSVCGQPIVDATWQNIISKFVPANLVQFYPVIVKARDGISQRYSFVIPFARVQCIDINRSEIFDKTEINNNIYIRSHGRLVYRKGCLGGYHLVREQQLITQILLSDELQSALLAEGGDERWFYRPEEAPLDS